MTIGKRIRDRRIELGMSADDLAASLGKNRATVYRYESGEIENMPISVIIPLAEVLRVSPSYLMGWSETTDMNTEKKTADPEADGKRKDVIQMLQEIPDEDLDLLRPVLEALRAKHQSHHQ